MNATRPAAALIQPSEEMGEQSLKSASLKVRGLGYLWDKDEARGKVTGGEKMVRLSSFYEDITYRCFHGMHAQKIAALTYSEGGVFGP